MKNIRKASFLLGLIGAFIFNVAGCSCNSNRNIDLLGGTENLSEEQLYNHLISAYQNKAFYDGDFTITEEIKSKASNSSESSQIDLKQKATYNNSTNEGYFIIDTPSLAQGNRLMSEQQTTYIVREDEEYTHYYSETNDDNTYYDLFFSDKDYLKDTIQSSVTNQAVFKDVDPKEYTNITTFTNALSTYFSTKFSVSNMNIIEKQIVENAKSDYYYKVKLVSPEEFSKDVQIDFTIRYDKTTIVGYIYNASVVKYSDSTRKNKVSEEVSKIDFSKKYDSEGMSFDKSKYEGKTKGQFVNTKVTLVLNANKEPTRISSNLVSKVGDNVYNRLQYIVDKYSDEENIFKGWFYNSDRTNKLWPDENFTIDTTLEIFGEINRVLYTIDTNVIGATNGYVEVVQTGAKGDSIVVYAEPNDGYVVSEMYYVKEGDTTKYYFTDKFTMPNSKITVHVELGTVIKLHTKEDLVRRLTNIFYWSNDFVLCNDIDLGGMEWNNTENSIIVWQGASFTGTFDGNGYSIYNYKINSKNDSLTGFFPRMSDATINIVMK